MAHKVGFLVDQRDLQWFVRCTKPLFLNLSDGIRHSSQSVRYRYCSFLSRKLYQRFIWTRYDRELCCLGSKKSLTREKNLDLRAYFTGPFLKSNLRPDKIEQLFWVKKSIRSKRPPIDILATKRAQPQIHTRSCRHEPSYQDMLGLIQANHEPVFLHLPCLLWVRLLWTAFLWWLLEHGCLQKA